MKRLCLFIAAAVAPLMLTPSAHALSCARPDLVKTLEEAKASEKLYHILVGKFITVSPRPLTPYNEILRPEDQFKPRPPVITRTFFEGYSLAKRPYMDSRLTRFPVDIETSCAGPWCSSVPSSDRPLIAFVEARHGQAPLLKISPCPSWTFPAEPQKVAKLRQCLDRTCQPENRHW